MQGVPSFNQTNSYDRQCQNIMLTVVCMMITSPLLLSQEAARQTYSGLHPVYKTTPESEHNLPIMWKYLVECKFIKL